MRVDKWFASLDRRARKRVLTALHHCRDFSQGSVQLHVAAAEAKIQWPFLEDLLQALDDDHCDLKNLEMGTDGAKYCNLCERSVESCRAYQ